MRILYLIVVTSIPLSPAFSFSVGGRGTTISSFSVRTKTKKLTTLTESTRHQYMSTSETPETSTPCPVIKFSAAVSKGLATIDKKLLRRIIRITNHLPALLSLSYFFLISMAQMMSMGGSSPTVAAMKSAKPTLSSVLTQSVGSTSNTEFSKLFPTNITPASFVFLVWPLISVLQLLTVTTSALFPFDSEYLSQSDLSVLTLANLFSSGWLFISSKAKEGLLPIGSALILPFVPLFSAFPLRNKPTYYLPAFELYSSFTTLASFLAFTVEIQHGGRIPFFGKVSAEVAGSAFLLLYSTASLAVTKKSLTKRLVNFGALTGILYKRVIDTTALTFMGRFSSLLLSVSFLGTVGCWLWSLKELVGNPTK